MMLVGSEVQDPVQMCGLGGVPVYSLCRSLCLSFTFYHQGPLHLSTAPMHVFSFLKRADPITNKLYKCENEEKNLLCNNANTFC